jgi:hypothetical protein
MAGLLGLQSCSDDSVSPDPDISDQVFNNDGGLVITHGVLNKKYKQMTFPATHNSHTYHGFWAELCLGGTKNQGLSIASQLEHGIRYIEFNINCYFNLCHGGIHSPISLYDELVSIREYVETHPNQIITVRISDVNRDPCRWVSPLDIYAGVNDRLQNSGLADLPRGPGRDCRGIVKKWLIYWRLWQLMAQLTISQIDTGIWDRAHFGRIAVSRRC